MRRWLATVSDDNVLGFIQWFTREYGYPPSVREMAEGLNLKSTASIAWHVERLISRGQVRRSVGKARSLVVVK